MNIHDVAGRHSAYTTQFWRAVRSRYPTRAAQQQALSKKALERRLVLPLDNHNWERALEVLDARYSRRGRTAAHYQRVIQDMVRHHAPSLQQTRAAAAAPTHSVTHSDSPHARQERWELARALDTLRDRAYAEEIPVSSSLWSTFVWAYTALGEPLTALECVHQARRRFTISAPTARHMAETVFPALCAAGEYAEAKEVADTLLTSSEATASPHSAKTAEVGGEVVAGPTHYSALDRAKITALLAEAAAMQGEWRAALSHLRTNGVPPEPSATSAFRQPDVGRPLRTVDGLFRDEGGSKWPTTAGAAPPPEAPASPNPRQPTARASPLTETTAAFLSVGVAGRWRLLEGLCDDGAWQAAAACWELMLADPAMAPALSSDVLKRYLNCLGTAGQTERLVDTFSTLLLGQPAARYLNASPEDAGAPAATTAASPLPQLQLDEVMLNMVFSSFRARAEELPGGRGAVPVLEQPHAVIRLLDDLLLSRDDMALTDLVATVAAAALLQTGQHTRALHLLRHCPLLEVTRAAGGDGGRLRVPEASSEAQRTQRDQIIGLIYAIHGASPEMRRLSVEMFPFVFPPELLRKLSAEARLGELGSPTHDGQDVKDAAKAPTPAELDAEDDTEMTDEERLQIVESRKRPTSLRPSRHHYFPPTPAAALSEMQDAETKRRLHALYERRQDAFAGDAAADPRPVPKGIHDHANGWDVAGRGGEMVFFNSRRVAHPFSMHPKVMRSKADPYRGWSPRQNSSLAHRENVIKWNRNSAV